MLITIIVMVGIILSILIALSYLKNNPSYISEFLKKHPEKTSIYLIRNDSILISTKEKLMPLASTVKIIIALEYSLQVSRRKLMKNDTVNLADINKFYLPNTDAGAHKNWLKEMKIKNFIQDNSVPLEEIVKGMIKFSSNANAEYLIDKLGIENITSTIRNEKLQHTPLYPFVSSLILCSQSSELTDSNYISESWKIHEKLKAGDDEPLKSFKIPKLSVQKIWSDKLPASSTKDYCNLMNKINTGKLSDTIAAKHLKEILTWPLEFNPVNKDYFTSLGMKGGSTAFVVTEALFATDKSGNTTALAIFFNDLADWEKILIDWNLNKFEQRILLDEKFRNAVKNKLSS